MSSPGIFFIHEMPYLGCRLPAYWGGTFPFPWYLWLFLLSMFLGFWIWLWLYIDDCLCLDRLSGRSLNRWSGEHGISVLNFLVCFDLLFAVSSFSSLSTICWITFPNFSVSDLNSVSDCFMLLSCPPFLRGSPPPLPYNWIITTTASVTELHSLSIHRHFISTGMILNRWFRASDSCVSKSRLLYVLCANCRISSFTSAKVSPGIRFSHLKFWKPSVFVFKTSKSLVHALY